MEWTNADEILAGRAALYEYFFTAYYKAFTKELLAYTPAFISTISALAENSSIAELQAGSEKLHKFEQVSKNLSDDELAQTLNSGYSKLYLTGDRIAMNENIFREGEKDKSSLMLNIIDYFANCNIMKPMEINLPSDSLAVELYFMFRMAEKLTKDDVDSAYILEQQQSFLNNHLSVWYRSFADVTVKHCANDIGGLYYAGLAESCLGFTMYDKGLLELFGTCMADTK